MPWAQPLRTVGTEIQPEGQTWRPEEVGEMNSTILAVLWVIANLPASAALHGGVVGKASFFTPL